MSQDKKARCLKFKIPLGFDDIFSRFSIEDDDPNSNSTTLFKKLQQTIDQLYGGRFGGRFKMSQLKYLDRLGQMSDVTAVTIDMILKCDPDLKSTFTLHVVPRDDPPPPPPPHPSLLPSSKVESKAKTKEKDDETIKFTIRNQLFQLAAAFEKGIGVKKSSTTMFQLRLMAAEEGMAEAQNEVAASYLHGYGVQKDTGSAYYWYQKSADQDNAIGQNQVGICYEKGLGRQIDKKTAFSWYEKSAQQNEAHGLFNVARYYKFGKGGVEKDEKKAFEIFKRMTEEFDHVRAETQLALCYELGRGTMKDEKRAVEIYLKEKCFEAQVRLGVCYELGKVVPQDQKRAIELYRKTPQDSDSRHKLGCCYEHGNGVIKNEVRAYELYLAAAIRDEFLYIIENNMALARCYEHGRGVQKDEIEALRCYENAAVRGSIEARECYFLLKKKALDQNK
jgi:TPR repeat protein